MVYKFHPICHKISGARVCVRSSARRRRNTREYIPRASCAYGIFVSCHFMCAKPDSFSAAPFANLHCIKRALAMLRVQKHFIRAELRAGDAATHTIIAYTLCVFALWCGCKLHTPHGQRGAPNFEYCVRIIACNCILYMLL